MSGGHAREEGVTCWKHQSGHRGSKFCHHYSDPETRAIGLELQFEMPQPGRSSPSKRKVTIAHHTECRYPMM